MSKPTGDNRTRCRCDTGGCACTRAGRPAPAPVGLPATLAAASRSSRTARAVPNRAPEARMEAQRYAYRVYSDESGGIALDGAAVALVGRYATLTAAGRTDEAAAILAALRRNARHRSALASWAAPIEVAFRATAGLSPGERIDPRTEPTIEAYAELAACGASDEAAQVLSIVWKRAGQVRDERARARLDALAEQVHGREWVLAAAAQRRARAQLERLWHQINAPKARHV